MNRPMNFTPKTTRLPSGLTILTQEMPSMASVSAGVWVGVGGRHEPAHLSGVSHFIEHLLFKWSRRFDAQTIAETFDAMGAELNAATSRENTVVFAQIGRAQRLNSSHIPLSRMPSSA